MPEPCVSRGTCMYQFCCIFVLISLHISTTKELLTQGKLHLTRAKKTEVRFQKMASAISQKRTCLFQETDMRFLALQQCLMMNDMIRDWLTPQNPARVVPRCGEVCCLVLRRVGSIPTGLSSVWDGRHTPPRPAASWPAAVSFSSSAVHALG